MNLDQRYLRSWSNGKAPRPAGRGEASIEYDGTVYVYQCEANERETLRRKFLATLPDDTYFMALDAWEEWSFGSGSYPNRTSVPR